MRLVMKTNNTSKNEIALLLVIGILFISVFLPITTMNIENTNDSNSNSSINRKLPFNFGESTKVIHNIAVIQFNTSLVCGQPSCDDGW